jgi:hypothetical protein
LGMPSFLCDQNHNILISRLPNQFKVEDTNGSTSRTRSLLNLTSMGLPPLMLAKVWKNWLHGMLCHPMLKPKISRHCCLYPGAQDCSREGAD